MYRATVKQQKQPERLVKNEMEIDPILLEEVEWKTFDTLYALDSFGAYWLENERLIKEAAEAEEKRSGPKWIPHTAEEYAEFDGSRRDSRHLQDEIVTPTFRYSCVVMLYAIVERELLRLVENLEKERGIQKLKHKDLRGSLLTQVAKFAEVFFNLRLPDCPQHNALCDLQKVRDCIVHCRGELTLFKEEDRAYLVGLKDRRPGFFAWERADIEIEPP